MAFAAIASFWALAVLLIFEFPLAPLAVLSMLFRLKLVASAVILAFVGARTLDRLGVAGGFFLASTAAHLGIGLLVWLQFSSSEWASVAGHAKLKFFSLVTFAAVVVGARAVIDAWGVEKVFRGVLAVLTASAAVVVGLPFWVNAGLPLPPGVSFLHARYLGTFTNPVISGFAGCATASLGAVLLGRRRSGWMAFSALSLGFASMAMGFSRGPAVSFVALMAFFLVRGPGLRRLLLLIWIAAMAAVLALAFATVDWATVLNPEQGLRLISMGDLLTGNISRASLAGRSDIWTAALREYWQSPVIGQGLGEMLHIEDGPVIGTPFSRERGPGSFFRAGAHNHFLAMGGEAGIVPMMLFALGLAALARAAWTLPRSYPVDAALGIAALVTLMAMSESNIDGFSPVVFVLGVACAFVADASDKRRQAPSRRQPGRPAPPVGARLPASGADLSAHAAGNGARGQPDSGALPRATDA